LPTGYRGQQFQGAVGRSLARVMVEIVKRSDQAKTFVVLPRRWIVERTLAWLGRCRRLAKDWECLNRRALAFLRLASIRPSCCENYAIPRNVFGQTLRAIVCFQPA
jgi:transposase